MSNFFAKLREGISFVVTAITALLISPALANACYQLFAQFWQGFSRVFDPENLPYLARAAHSRRVLAQSVITNLGLYAGAALFYEAGIRRLLRAGVPMIEDSYVECGIDVLVRICLLGLAARFRVNNAMLDVSMLQAAKLDNPLKESCRCDTPEKLQGQLERVAYFGGSYAAVRGIETILPITSLPLNSMLFGRHFVEQRVGRDRCLQHANEIVNKNNAYAFGQGLSFMMTLRISSWLLQSVAGAESVFVRDALYCLLYQYFLMLSFANQKPLPVRVDDVDGYDLAAPTRAITQTIMKSAKNIIEPILKAPGKGVDWTIVQCALNYYPLRLGQQLLFGADISTYEDFLLKPIPLLLFSLHDQTITRSLNDLEAWAKRTSRYGFIVYWLPEKIVPSFKKEVVHQVSEAAFYTNLEKIREWMALIRNVQQRAQAGGESRQEPDGVTFVSDFSNVRLSPLLALPASPPVSAESHPMQTVAAFLDMSEVISADAGPHARPVLQPLAADARSVVSEVTFNAASAIKEIALLPEWSGQGTGWRGAKIPDHILRIRFAKEDLVSIYDAIKDKFNSSGELIAGFSNPFTKAFYQLIKDCYDQRHAQSACKEKIDRFCLAQKISIHGLSQPDRINGMAY